MSEEDIQIEFVSASVDRGVLEIRIPKPEARKPRRISIANGGQAAIEGEAREAAPAT